VAPCRYFKRQSGAILRKPPKPSRGFGWLCAIRLIYYGQQAERPNYDIGLITKYNHRQQAERLNRHIMISYSPLDITTGGTEPSQNRHIMISHLSLNITREQAEGGDRQASRRIMMRVPGVSPAHHNMATWTVEGRASMSRNGSRESFLTRSLAFVLFLFFHCLRR
jgi:hypothetical protein